MVGVKYPVFLIYSGVNTLPAFIKETYQATVIVMNFHDLEVYHDLR